MLSFFVGYLIHVQYFLFIYLVTQYTTNSMLLCLVIDNGKRYGLVLVSNQSITVRTELNSKVRKHQNSMNSSEARPGLSKT